MVESIDSDKVPHVWYREKKASVIMVVVLCLTATCIWYCWDLYQKTFKEEQATQAYYDFVIAIETNENSHAQRISKFLLANFPKSLCSTLTAMRMAKVAFDNGDSTTAIQQLEWVIENTSIKELQDIARLRLARVLVATGNYGYAEQQLASISTVSLTSEKAEIRGDLALANNDPVKAKTAFVAARAAGNDSSILQLKIDDLTGSNNDSTTIAPSLMIPDISKLVDMSYPTIIQ
jgi:predicted negative regulator of RcsB-dependent stress response